MTEVFIKKPMALSGLLNLVTQGATFLLLLGPLQKEEKKTVDEAAITFFLLFLEQRVI